ncbi:hypothetical protein DFH08DRAFT_805187 [Mycena albidolilacea]|uniref:Uncharacterized protein n=1 Tax=Mycena albidolilacea TaxID=1033008 RepID=A0AAD7EXZ3_9AGAR|nr:hypothetical protein DFH08DRAFT_805187 [Mycena albidolilacea]
MRVVRICGCWERSRNGSRSGRRGARGAGWPRGGGGDVEFGEEERTGEIRRLALSTFTSAPRALPHAIHFSHQFAYYTLDKDCHALIRRYQFAIGRAKIDVRREVEASAFAFGPGVDASASGEAFVEGYGVSASFDEPLASALAGTHYCDARPPPLDARARSRWARGQRRGRSGEAAPLVRKAGGGGDDIEASVSLEFDEEDQDISECVHACEECAPARSG